MRISQAPGSDADNPGVLPGFRLPLRDLFR
jgi:hypothetical protein